LVDQKIYALVYARAIKYLEALNENLKYHSSLHTLSVLENCVLLAKKENINLKDTFLLKTAALYHDLGFLRRYDNNEELACDIARKIYLNWDIQMKSLK